MSRESAFIAMMRAIASGPAARGLLDDAAVIELGGEALILTHDMMAEGIHWLPHASPADVAWKLVAANLSDLAAKGAEPLGLLLGYSLSDAQWDMGFAAGLHDAVGHFDVPLLGGDSVGDAGGRILGMTAIGRASYRPVPARSGAQAGDILYVTGWLGDAKAGFDLENGADEGGCSDAGRLRRAFKRPAPRLSDGRALAPLVTAMMDVSDGLLIDAQRMAAASNLQLTIDLAHVPLSPDYVSLYGDNTDSRIEAASWGDDYQLLFALPNSVEPPVAAVKLGQFDSGQGLKLTDNGTATALPARLGFEHG
ncbi:thiamine-phosphate kinase [Sphingorhabdus arenilitoris]|uniref:Thiamine-monophosphate kinase n=1 Tax=Sphingorhabdus arenilitoris TaxID=1490041 RepID=A0ABV8RIC7_9SPHN